MTFEKYKKGETIDKNVFDLDFLTYSNNIKYLKRKKSGSKEKGKGYKWSYRGEGVGRQGEDIKKVVVEGKEGRKVVGLKDNLRF